MRDNPQLIAKNLTDLKPLDFATYRDQRMQVVTPTTVSREMEILSAVLHHSIRELGWLTASPMTMVSRPKLPPPRNRRAFQHEIDAIVAATGYCKDEPLTKSSHEVGWAILFAVETAMRLGEIVSIQWSDVYLRDGSGNLNSAYK